MARNLLAENQSVQKAQQTSIYILGWISLAFGFLGGAYMAETWMGDTLRWILGLIPWGPLPNVLLFVGAVAFVIDTINDLTPNQAALSFAILAPSVAIASEGGLASAVSSWTNALQAGVGGQVSGLVGNLGASGLAIICIAGSLMIGRRVLAKQSGRAGGR